MSVSIQAGPRGDSPADYMIIQPQSPEEIILDSSISSRSKSDDSGSLEVTNTDSDEEGNLKIDEDADEYVCHICDRSFEDETILQVHHSIHKVDFLTWKSRSHIKSTVMKSCPESVRCIGCTFFYAKKECFVSSDGSKSVCTFCYETTRSKHLKNFGSIKMNRDLFEFTDFLIYDNMRIATSESSVQRTQNASGRQLRLSEEEKVARVKAINNELAEKPDADLNELCSKWSIKTADYQMYKDTSSNSTATTGKVTMPKTWKTEAINPAPYVCPVTKLPLSTIKRIKQLLQEAKGKNDPSFMLKLVEKYNVNQADLQKYMALIVSNGEQRAEQNKYEQQAQLSKLLSSKNVVRLTPVTISTSTPNVSTQVDIEKVNWTDGRNSFPSMVQSQSVIPCSRASPVSTIPLSTNASRVSPALTNAHQANLDAPRRGGAKKSTRNICINCGTNTATLWRRIKSPEEIELKRPGLVAQREFPQYTGKLACNSCALYWSLHGKHRVVSENSTDTPRRRNRKKNYDKASKIHGQPLTGPPCKQPKLAPAPPTSDPTSTNFRMTPKSLDNFPAQVKASPAAPIPTALSSPSSSSPNLNLSNLNLAALSGIDLKAHLQLLLSLQLQSDPAAAAALLPFLQNLQGNFTSCEIKEEPSDEMTITEVDQTDSFDSITSSPFTSQKSPPNNSSKPEIPSMNCSSCRITIFAPEEGQPFPCQQCPMCPKSIYCNSCIHSIDHLKLHSAANLTRGQVDISTV
ncbi:unnamed protein product [Oikopleura dioica]|uniref:C2H2-type domain-containing protein n=1 Tax=Oikopleura dioica TaxID=34765 RepID=E4WW54_OIKDI|nr:unnamed protein product [Oikopleura dioica]